MGSGGADDGVCGISKWGTHLYPVTNLNNDGKQRLWWLLMRQPKQGFQDRKL